MKKVFLILFVLLFVLAAFLLSSGLPWRNSAGAPDPSVVSTENGPVPAEQPVAAPEPTPEPTPTPSPDPTITPVEEIPEIEVTEEFVIELEENQGTDGV